MEHCIGSSLMISLKGPEILKEEQKLIVEEGVAGVILFQRNILSCRQLFELCQELKALALRAKNTPYFFIGIDLEGGKVNRLVHLKEVPSWPSPLEMSRLSRQELFLLACRKGLLLSALGVDINFSPLVDIPLKNSPLLKTRTFGVQKRKISSCALAYSKGLSKGGVAPCLKHFPGHGGVTEDSHEVLPKDNRSLKSLRAQMDIFQQVFKAGVPFIMTAHLEFPEVEKGPATFSRIFLRRELRERLQFKGVIVSDDIDMKALSEFSPGERFVKALSGGCNLVLCCQKPKTPYEILKFCKDSKRKAHLQPFLKESFERLLLVKKERPKETSSWERVQQALKLLNSS